MKFHIGEKAYDADEGAAKASLQTLYVMKTKYGIGMKSLVEMSKRLVTMTDPLELFEDEEAFNAFRAMIWLARLAAGETLSIEDACDFPIEDMTFDAEDEPEVADPKAPEDSAPAEKRRPATTHTSKTSKPRSTKTS